MNKLMKTSKLLALLVKVGTSLLLLPEQEIAPKTRFHSEKYSVGSQ